SPCRAARFYSNAPPRNRKDKPKWRVAVDNGQHYGRVAAWERRRRRQALRFFLARTNLNTLGPAISRSPARLPANGISSEGAARACGSSLRMWLLSSLFQILGEFHEQAQSFAGCV